MSGVDRKSKCSWKFFYFCRKNQVVRKQILVDEVRVRTSLKISLPQLATSLSPQVLKTWFVVWCGRRRAVEILHLKGRQNRAG